MFQIDEPVVAPKPKPTLPYPSRMNKQKLKEKDDIVASKFVEILKNLHFELSLADALLFMPKFALMFKSILNNKEKLYDLTKTPVNENCSAVILKKLPEKLGDPGRFLIPCDFPELVDCKALADLGASINLMPLSVWEKLSLPPLTPTRMILELADRTISTPSGIAEDVYVKVGKFHFPTDFVVLICEAKNEKSSINDPPELELKDLPSHLEYAFLEGDDKLPVISAKNIKDDEKARLFKVLKSHKRTIAWKISDIKGIDPNFCTHKILMEDDFKPAVQNQRRVNPKIHEMLKRWEKCHFMCREGIVLGHKISKSRIEVDRAKVDVIAKLPHLTTVKGVRSFLGHAGFYRRFIQDFSKIARPMTHLLEKETPFVFSKDCIDAFQTLKKKLTEAPILVVPDWNLPFELMCDASDFAIGAVLGQRKMKHFQPIHYASKTMTEAQIHYTTTEKEMLAVVYAFEKFRPYLVLSKSIVYTDHSALKYLMNKQDAKPRLLRLENPHKDVLENKDINEHFPLETLGVISSESTPWFADYANYHAGNFIIKGMSTQQKRKFFKDVKHYFWDDPYLFPVDYLSKWVEAKALPTNDARVVVKFLKSLFARFGTPRAIISDRGTHFCNDQFAKVMSKYRVTHHLAIAYHLQTSGQVEVSNRGLKHILERTVGENRASWSDKLDDALWAFRTAFKTPISCTLYKLVYGKSCHLPIELEHKAYWPLKHANFDLKTAGDHQKLQLNELKNLLTR
ncbi:reverse transcriptase domain-containing protein [Tanacetum coccineum]|uniref:Reverse transcriptase domain-containing protein n=1 Tax=Tanacetum coccineum TaxID=301880 RepID=A0ABQ5IJE8_9ASTR